MGRRGEGARLTEADGGSDEGERDDPVVLAPDDPAAVKQDEVAEQVAEGDEDVGGDERHGFVREASDASRVLRRARGQSMPQRDGEGGTLTSVE